MAHFIRCLELEMNVLAELNLLSTDAAAWKEREVAAATKLQSFWRCKAELAVYKHLRAMTQVLQRCYRGHCGRKRVRSKKRLRNVARERSVFDYYAEMIQKIYRGHSSRRYRHDFWARKKYIEMVVKKGAELQEKLKVYAQQQAEIQAKQRAEKKENEFKEVSSNLHHLLSTKSCPGIYNSPYAQDDDLLPTINGEPVENHLRGAVKEYLKTHKMTQRHKIKRPRNRLSIQASSQYDVVKERTRMEKKFRKIRHISKKPFLGGATYKEPAVVGGIGVGEPYEDPWRSNLTTKQLQERNKAARMSQEPFHTSVRTGGGFDEDEPL